MTTREQIAQWYRMTLERYDAFVAKRTAPTVCMLSNSILTEDGNEATCPKENTDGPIHIYTHTVRFEVAEVNGRPWRFEVKDTYHRWQTAADAQHFFAAYFGYGSGDGTRIMDDPT